MSNSEQGQSLLTVLVYSLIWKKETVKNNYKYQLYCYTLSIDKRIIYKYFIRRIKAKKKPSLRYLKHKEQARALVSAKLLQWNQLYGFTYHRIAIRDTKTRWGSCSKKGNLNFNYKILFLPESLADYIIVHELCHLYEFNHSQRFWDLVAKTIPDYEVRRNELRSKNMRTTG